MSVCIGLSRNFVYSLYFRGDIMPRSCRLFSHVKNWMNSQFIRSQNDWTDMRKLFFGANTESSEFCLNWASLRSNLIYAITNCLSAYGRSFSLIWLYNKRIEQQSRGFWKILFLVDLTRCVRTDELAVHPLLGLPTLAPNGWTLHVSD